MRLANIALVFCLTIVLARTLGPRDLGIYAFAISVVTILSIPAMAGIPTLFVREIARFSAQESWDLMKGLLIRGGTVALSLSIGIGTLTASVLVFIGGIRRGTPGDAGDALLWALLLIPLLALGELRTGALRGLHRTVAAQVPEMLVRPGSFILMMLALSGLGAARAETAVLAYVAAAALAFAIGARYLQRALPAQVAHASPRFRDREWFNSVVPLSLLMGAQIVNHQADLVALGIFASKEEVGMYRVAVQGASLVTLSMHSINIVVSSFVSQMFSRGEMDRLQRLVTLGCRVAFLVALPVAAVFIVFGDEILGFLFGEAFTGGYTALAILSLGSLGSLVFGPVVSLLNMTGKESLAARGVIVAAGVNVMLNLVLVPWYGMAGAALATVAALLISSALLARQAWMALGLRTTLLGPR